MWKVSDGRRMQRYSEKNQIRKSDIKTNLILTSLDDIELGTYRCRVENIFGVAIGPINIVQKRKGMLSSPGHRQVSCYHYFACVGHRKPFTFTSSPLKPLSQNNRSCAFEYAGLRLKPIATPNMFSTRHLYVPNSISSKLVNIRFVFISDFLIWFFSEYRTGSSLIMIVLEIFPISTIHVTLTSHNDV
jgi:hypothetical protein